MNWKGLPAAFAAVFASVVLLGSTLCGGDPSLEYESRSRDYESRWNRGNAQGTLHWAADYSRIVFGDLGRIYVVDADGGSITSMSDSADPVHSYTDTTKVDFSSFPSPDGASVVYTTLRYAEGDPRDHSWEIATQSLDGSDRQRLTNNEWDDVSPAWSPDGSRIAFISSREDGYRLFTMAPDGSEQRSIAPSVPVLPDAPWWSPDGSRLAFVGVEGEQEAIYTVKVDGSDMTKIPWPDTASVNMVISKDPPDWGYRLLPGTLWWSPDGERVAFLAGTSREPKTSLFVATTDGSEARQIANAANIETILDYPVTFSLLAWSVDSAEIGFEIADPGLTAYLVRRDGSNLRKAVEAGDAVAFQEWASGLAWGGPWRLRLAGAELSRYSWGSASSVTDKKLLARSVNGQWVAAHPPQFTASEEAGRCSKWRVGGNPLTNGGLVRDCRTLLEMRDTLAGDETLYWSADVPVREWPGITVEGRPPRVTELLSVPSVMLKGRIPPGIGNLERLRTLALAANELTGSIPPEIGNLRRLEVLDLGNSWYGHNGLTGSIPPALGNLSSLKVLDLSSNSFVGAIPADLGNLASLEELTLNDNPLDGPIPPELGNLNNLRVLNLGGNRNQLTGTVPPELGNLANLEELTINSTGVTGPIPPELGNLSQLQELHLRGNQLNGPIPPELGELENLSELLLDGNQFTGCAPPTLRHVWEYFVDVPFCN